MKITQASDLTLPKCQKMTLNGSLKKQKSVRMGKEEKERGLTRGKQTKGPATLAYNSGPPPPKAQQGIRKSGPWFALGEGPG